MANMSGVVEQLKQELERAKKEVEQFGAALVALGSSSSNGSRGILSAAARKKISLAQKARWAKQKGQVARPKRTMSAAGRRRIAAGQRARWAKVKGQKKAA
jgi:outer membrane PBP1 activator LpoA protein